MWGSAGGLWPRGSEAESLSVPAQTGPLYMGRAQHKESPGESEETAREHQGKRVDMSKGSARALGRGEFCPRNPLSQT